MGACVKVRKSERERKSETERMCEIEREPERGGREKENRDTESRRERDTKKVGDTERDGDRAIARERGRLRGREKTCRAHIMLQNVQDATWNETSQPKSVNVYVLSHQIILAIQSNKDIHNTQSNHIVT